MFSGDGAVRFGQHLLRAAAQFTMHATAGSTSTRRSAASPRSHCSRSAACWHCRSSPCPQPSLVLAYTPGIVALLPLTRGGLGIVEASMSGVLILAGVHATYAFLAALAYRIASHWLALLAGPPAYLLFCLRYGRPVPRRASPGEGGQPSAGGRAQ